MNAIRIKKKILCRIRIHIRRLTLHPLDGNDTLLRHCKHYCNHLESPQVSRTVNNKLLQGKNCYILWFGIKRWEKKSH